MKIDTEECTPYHLLGMLKLCYDMQESLEGKEVLKALAKSESKRKRVTMNMVVPSLGAGRKGQVMLTVALVIGLCGTLSVALLLPSLLVSGLLGLMCLTTRLGTKVALKVGDWIHKKGKSGGERMLGTSSKSKRNWQRTKEIIFEFKKINRNQKYLISK